MDVAEDRTRVLLFFAKQKWESLRPKQNLAEFIKHPVL